LQLLIVSIKPAQEAFKLQMLDLNGWLMAILLGLVPLIINELIKLVVRFRTKASGS